MHNSVSIFGTIKISRQADDRSNHQGMGEPRGEFSAEDVEAGVPQAVHPANELPADHALGQEAVEHLTAEELF